MFEKIWHGMLLFLAVWLLVTAGAMLFAGYAMRGAGGAMAMTSLAAVLGMLNYITIKRRSWGNEL